MLRGRQVKRLGPDARTNNFTIQLQPENAKKLITFVGAASLCQLPTLSACLNTNRIAAVRVARYMCFAYFNYFAFYCLLQMAAISLTLSFFIPFIITLFSLPLFFVVWSLLLDRNGKVILAIMVEDDSEKWVPSSRIKWSLKLSSNVK